MNTQTLELLERSRLFSSSRDVKQESHRMDFPFRSRTVFFREGNEENDFSDNMTMLVKIYMRCCVEKMSNKLDQKEKNINKLWESVFSFAEDFDPKQIFQKISFGRDWFDINIGINNSILRVKRFGNCFGFDVRDRNGDSHKEGFQIMTEMCNSQEPIIAPFIHRIGCSIPMPKNRGKENSADVDFGFIHNKLQDSCRHIKWKPAEEWYSDLVKSYITVSQNVSVIDKGVVVGNYEDIEIQAVIIHSENSDYQKTQQWRRGNISIYPKNPLWCNFCEDGDLRLLLMTHSGFKLHNYANDFETTLNIAQLQYHLNLAGGVLYTQLCCMLETEGVKNTSAYL